MPAGRPRRAAIRALSLLAVGALAACGDLSESVGPEAAGPEAPAPLASVTCTASTVSGTVACEAADGAAGGPVAGLNPQVRAVILGGQGEYVQVRSSNVVVQADTFAFDVTVENLIRQPLGTTDFLSAHPNGVRVFFAGGPTPTPAGAGAGTGAGTMTVANPDGVATFTAASQPYFQYDGVLNQGEETAARQWKLQFSPEVTSFTFTLYVEAEVPYPNGYIDETPYVVTLNPGETRTLTGTPRTVTGRVAPEAAVTWTSENPAVASVTGSQVTAGPTSGFTTLAAVSDERSVDSPTSVSVCPATMVSDGTILPAAISATDCFSSFGSREFRPSSSYYGDLYRVSLAEGQTIEVVVDTLDDLDSYLVLTAPNTGIPVAANDDDDEGELGVGSRIVYTATETGVYVFEVSTFNGLDTGTYTLGVTVS